MHMDALEHAHRHLDRLEALEQRTAEIHERLLSEALQALVNAPEQLLEAPSFSNSTNRETAARLFDDFLTEDYNHTATVLRILALLDKSQGGSAEARLMAQGLIAAAAKRYADNYADAIAENE